MNSLEFIKKHIEEWAFDDCKLIHLDALGAIRCYNSKLGLIPILCSTPLSSARFFDGEYWTREEFESCDISGRISTVNRDIERGAIDAVLNERGSRYGKFKDGADIIQKLKSVMRSTNGWDNLSPSQREALEMIQHKVGRILNGDPNYDDNWIDISGYSKLVADELNGESK